MTERDEWHIIGDVLVGVFAGALIACLCLLALISIVHG